MTFKIYTLGCKVNTYESNVIKDSLVNHGYEEVEEDIADTYIINTCTVTDTSAHKSLKVIRQCIRKNQNAIISDSFKQEFGMVPLEEKGMLYVAV